MNYSIPSQQLLILVVGDASAGRRAIEHQLTQSGCKVWRADDVQSALALLAEHSIDLILLDSFREGDAFANQLRVGQRNANASTSVAPIFAIVEEVDVVRGPGRKAGGPDEVLEKPVTAEVLKDMLSRWSRMKIADHQEDDLHALFCSTSFDDLSAMRAALSRSDLVAVHNLAHRMKGAALAMHANDVVATLERIEALVLQVKTDALSALPAELEALQRQLLAV